MIYERKIYGVEFKCNSETGQLWRKYTSGWKETGLVENGQGYLQLTIMNYKFKAHRVVWFMVHGTWPKQVLDHINNVRHDNSIANLREVAPWENRANSTQVIIHKNGRFAKVE